MPTSNGEKYLIERGKYHVVSFKILNIHNTMDLIVLLSSTHIYSLSHNIFFFFYNSSPSIFFFLHMLHCKVIFISMTGPADICHVDLHA